MARAKTTSQGITATMTIISVARLSPRLEAESRTASQIGAKPLWRVAWHSMWKLISTATFPVSLTAFFCSRSRCLAPIAPRSVFPGCPPRSRTPSAGFARLSRMPSDSLLWRRCPPLPRSFLGFPWWAVRPSPAFLPEQVKEPQHERSCAPTEDSSAVTILAE